MLDLATELAFVVLIVWQAANLTKKSTVPGLGTSKVAFIIAAAGLLPILLMYSFALLPVSPYFLALSVLSGIFFASGNIFYNKALETEQVTNAVTLGLLQQVPVIIFSILILNEMISGITIVAGIFVIIGGYLVSTTHNMKFNRKLLPAAIGNILWAFYWIALSLAIAGSGQVAVPVVASRIISTIVLFVFMLMRPSKVQVKVTKPGYWKLIAIACFCGIMDGTGNALYAFIVSLGQLYIVGIVALLGPFIVAAVAYFMFKDRLTKVQLVGMVLAVIGATLVAIG